MRRIVKASTVAAGYRVTVEVENAYTDGTSRFDEVTVPLSVSSLPPTERLQAVLAALEGSPFDDFADVDLDTFDRLRKQGDAGALEKARRAIVP